MSASMQKSSPGTLAAFAGYILYSVYVCTTFYSPTTISSVVEIGYLPKALYLFFIILGRMVGFAIVTAVIMRKKGNPSRIALVAASAACGFIGFASMILVFQLTSVTDLGALLPWFYASGVWIGLGDSFLVVLWFAFVATMQIRRMYVFFGFLGGDQCGPLLRMHVFAFAVAVGCGRSLVFRIARLVQFGGAKDEVRFRFGRCAVR